MTRQEAREILARCGIDAAAMNFYTLRSTQVAALLRVADLHRYRAPRNANGSRGRYFHAFLQRSANRNEKE